MIDLPRMTHRGLTTLLTITLLTGLASPGFADTLTGTATVIDGDTLDIHGTRIRLHGIDAPESAQMCTDAAGQPWRCGQKAALALSGRIGRTRLRCEGQERDRYGRIIAVCFLNGEDINAWMVSDGWAMAYLRYSHDYARYEAIARTAGRGIWQAPFIAPWDWRRGQR